MPYIRNWWLALVLSMAIQSGCGAGRPPRPGNVPEDAVRISETKGTDIWQKCFYDEQGGGVRCEIFNTGGDLFHNEVFVPYVGDMPRSQQELQIVPRGGPDWVELANGTILIPRSQYDRIKNFLDWMNGKRSRP